MVEFEFLVDDGAGPPLSNASSVSVLRDASGYVSGDLGAEAEALDMEDVEDHEWRTTMAMIAIAERPPRVTFNADVAPIVFKRCAECHHPNGAAPFSLLTHRDSLVQADMIAEVLG